MDQARVFPFFSVQLSNLNVGKVLSLSKGFKYLKSFTLREFKPSVILWIFQIPIFTKLIHWELSFWVWESNFLPWQCEPRALNNNKNHIFTKVNWRLCVLLCVLLKTVCSTKYFQVFEVLHYVGSCIIKVLKLKVKRVRNTKIQSFEIQKFKEIEGEEGEKCLGGGRCPTEEENPRERSRYNQSGENCKNPNSRIQSDGSGWIARAGIGSARNDAAVPWADVGYEGKWNSSLAPWNRTS